MNINGLTEKIYSEKYLRVGLHTTFWIFFSGIQFYLNSVSFHPYKNFPLSIDIALVLASTCSIIIFFYPFVYFVLPRFFYKRRFVVGILFTILLVVLYAFYDTIREKLILKGCASCMATLKASGSGYYQFLQLPLPNRLFGKLASLGTVIGLIFSLALPLGIKLGMQALRNQLRSMQLQKDNLQLEFNFLRSQVNPHFLFNTLNNIYGLILNDQKEKSADLVARLSQFLRYTLYESESDQIAVDKEVQLLKDYIDLESIRLNHTRVKFNHKTDGSINRIAPMLMIPVVENAFKYCADHKQAYIDIDFCIENRQLRFSSKNSVDPDRQATGVGGIGLSNFCKRLQLYYNGMYQYLVSATENEYAVSVNITCHE